MRNMNKSIAAAVLAMAVAGGGYAFLGSPLTPTVQAHLRDHPKLAEADEALKEAEDYLRSAADDFHGHKEEALHAIHEARTKISLCAEGRASFNNIHAVPLEGRHEKLRVAREKLRAAKEYLREAKADFHGHKEEAIQAVDEAIHQLDRILGE